MTPLHNEFFNKYLFIHTHIEKCGGSSLLRHMTTLLGDKHVYDLRPLPPIKVNQLLKEYPEIKKNKHNIRLFSGHIWYNTPWEKLFSRTTFPYYKKRPLYIASVRQPIERLNSFFRYLKANHTHPYWKRANINKNNNFDEFIQELILNNHMKAKNGISMQLTGCSNSTNLLEKAKKSFEQDYFAIVPYNKTHELANMISEVLELPKVEDHIINLNSSEKKIIPSQETIALLTERCRDDIEFYDYVCKGYEEKLAKAKIHLQNLLKKH